MLAGSSRQYAVGPTFAVILNVEGHHGMLFMTNCLLLVGRSYSRCLGLSICVSGGFV